MELRPADFEGFFRAVHGCGPFPWQQELVDRLAGYDEWPDVLDLPTGAGKTAAMDAAVFHLALRADAPGKAALRIALVVDRRLVVDDAFERAKKIAKKLRCTPCDDGEGHEVVREVARRLCRLAGDGAPPLVARRLRGGAPLEHDWARTPTQPTILCSTVDQIGSRLLFRGYGVSDRMKPVHAGLLGTDSLILLDEAHLSEPFRQTLAAVRHVEGAGVRGVRTALLSATPGSEAKRPLRLSPADRAHPVLKERLEARKPVTLDVVRGKSAAIAEAFAEAARTMAERLRDQGVSPPAVGVVVNRVALARDVFNALNAEDGFDTMLMIGRSRDVGRNRIVEKLAPFRTGREDRPQAEPLFVVATQCLEVGVDLDLDGLVTQAASLDALRQRFGRLNRAGRQVPAEGAILARAEDIARKADDPVYGDRIRLTWEALQRIAEGGTVDFGAEALPRRLGEIGTDQEDLAAKRSSAPVVMPAYLDLWSQTSPRPAADPDVGLFLHGAERTAAGVSLVWRGDVAEDDLKNARPGELEELLRLVPPRASEAVDVPLWTARAWLRRVRGDAAALDTLSDAPEPEREDETPGMAANRKDGRPAFRWAGPGDARTGLVQPDGLRPGDMLIVPAEYGGCDRFGWAPDSDRPVEDLADEAARPFRGRRCAVRVARSLVQDDVPWSRVSEILQDEGATADDRIGRLLDVLPSRDETEPEGEESHGSALSALRNGLEALRRPRRGRLDVRFPYPGGREEGAVFVAEQGVEGAGTSDGAASATEDDSVSYTSGRPVELDDHGNRVACFAKRFAEALGLGEVADDLRLAAYLHDAGKADRRFQLTLSGGDPWNRPDGPPLAKSGRSWSPGAGKRAGLPEGWRHEALSVRMAPAHPRFAGAHDPALVLWLIGSHHGLGRPFFDFLDPAPDQEPLPCLDVADWRLATGKPGPQSLAFELRGADWPSLFEDLKRRYGIWGLAHLEAILRLADHRASEEERAL